MHHQLVARSVLGALIVLAAAGPAHLAGQAPAQGDALSAVVEAMYFRRLALGDSLPFDACSVYEHGGRPAGFPEGVLPGLRSLLDRPVADPCSVPAPGADGRFERRVRVDSVAIDGAAARVHLHVRRGEWTYGEVYYLAARPEGRGWSLREVRMSPPIHTTPPPRRH